GEDLERVLAWSLPRRLKLERVLCFSGIALHGVEGEQELELVRVTLKEAQAHGVAKRVSTSCRFRSHQGRVRRGRSPVVAGDRRQGEVAIDGASGLGTSADLLQRLEMSLSQEGGQEEIEPARAAR